MLPRIGEEARGECCHFDNVVVNFVNEVRLLTT